MLPPAPPGEPPRNDQYQPRPWEHDPNEAELREVKEEANLAREQANVAGRYVISGAVVLVVAGLVYGLLAWRREKEHDLRGEGTPFG